MNNWCEEQLLREKLYFDFWMVNLWKNTFKKTHSPNVSPLLSSGFVPGLFSWSTVCALDEEHPIVKSQELLQMRWLAGKLERQLKEWMKNAPKLSVSTQRLAGGEKTWNSYWVPKTSKAPLSPLVCVFMHGLLSSCPGQRLCCEQQLSSTGSCSE